MSSVLITIVVIVAAVVLGIALAYVPMRLLVGTIAKNVVSFIQRQRERRRTPRNDAPDRRKEEVVTPP